MRPRPKDHDSGTLEYAWTIRGEGGSLETLLVLFERAGIDRKKEDSKMFGLYTYHPRIFLAVESPELVEFDIYNIARVTRFHRVQPNKTDTRVYRQAVGEFTMLLLQAGYTTSAYRNEELKDIQFIRQTDWQI